MARTSRNETNPNATGAAGDARLRPVRNADDVFERYRGTPIEDLLAAQNLDRPFPVGPAPSLFVATCIDWRVRLALPPGAAFELRSAGVNLKHAFFQIAFAVSASPISHVALVSHDDCAMTKLPALEADFVAGLAKHARWSPDEAKRYFEEKRDHWHLEDAVATTLAQARELRERLPAVTFAPLHYTVGDGRLVQIAE